MIDENIELQCVEAYVMSRVEQAGLVVGGRRPAETGSTSGD